MKTTGDYLVLSLPEMKAALQRFEQRVGAALQAAPPSKDRVKRGLRRGSDGRCPVWLKTPFSGHHFALWRRSGQSVLPLAR